MTNTNCIYDKKYLRQCLCGMGVMIVLMYGTGGSGFLLIIPLMLFAILRNRSDCMLFYLVLTICSLVGNSNLMPKNGIYCYAQRLSMLMIAVCLSSKIFGSHAPRMLSCLLGMFPYIIYMALTAGSSWCPFISYLKLLLFTVVYFAYYGVCIMVVNSKFDLMPKIRSIFLSLCVFFVFGSVALIPFPAISQMAGEEYVIAVKSGAKLTSLFCGMTFHSQSLGPICAAIGTALFADMVIGLKRVDYLYIALLMCVPILLLKTSSRTAIGAFVVGVCCVTYFMTRARQLRNSWKSKVFNVMLLMVVVLTSFIMLTSSGQKKMASILTKDYSGTSAQLSQVSSDDIIKTRRGKWDEGIHNFRKSPMIGNGFQVSEEMQGLQPSWSILSAPVEKSIWISAVLEEGGAFGFAIFMIFIITACSTMFRMHAYISLSILIVFLTSNLGEFTLFSMSAGGGCLWALVFIGIMLDVNRWRGNAVQAIQSPQTYWRVSQ